MGLSPSCIYTAVSEGSFLWNFFLGLFLLFIFCRWPFALTFAKSSRLVFILYRMSHCFQYCNTGYFRNGCRHAQMALMGWLRPESKPHLQASFVSKILRIFILHSLSVDIPFNPTALEIHLCKTLHLFIFKTGLDGEICSSAVKHAKVQKGLVRITEAMWKWWSNGDENYNEKKLVQWAGIQTPHGWYVPSYWLFFFPFFLGSCIP